MTATWLWELSRVNPTQSMAILVHGVLGGRLFGWECVLLQRTELANIATTYILTDHGPHVPPVDSHS